MLTWDIYEVSSKGHALHGVKCRGRLRKYAVQNGIDLLTENASDKENVVRFALPAGIPPDPIVEFIRTLFDDASVERVARDVHNPVLSRLKINVLDRYEI